MRKTILVAILVLGSLPLSAQEALFIDSLGRVGVGTDSPQEALDVRGTVRTLTGDVLVREDDDGRDAALLTATSTRGTLLLKASGGTTTALNLPGGTSYLEGRLGMVGCRNPDHDLVIGGTGSGCNTGVYSEINAGESQFSTSSSRSMKMNIRAVEVDGLLDRISRIKVFSYDFKDGPVGGIGLMAEDFHSIFQRGPKTRLSGHEIQLALWLAVQELTEKTQELSEQNRALALQNAEMKRDIQQLRSAPLLRP